MIEDFLNFMKVRSFENGGVYFIDKESGSNFAKDICKDLNPIHNVESKKFIMLGDFLFALYVNEYGFPKNREVIFKNPIKINSLENSGLEVIVSKEGIFVGNQKKVESSVEDFLFFDESLLLQYCEISGSLFPDKLWGVFESSGLMPNFKRGIVMYTGVNFGFNFNLDSLYGDIELDLDNVDYEIVSNRLFLKANVKVDLNGENVGSICKNLVCLGCVDYNKEKFDFLVENYRFK